MAGKRGRCARCNVAFTVPTAPQEAEPPSEMPQYIGVACRLCGTRMYGGPDQIGKELKCPDCGARTVLPPPPKPKPKNIPAAMYGEQYELWEPGEQPLPSELVARQPKYIAVSCRKCGTLMYATEKQVGETMACPDCRTKHVVPAPAKPKPAPSPMTSDAETPTLDAAADPGERPPVIIPPRRKMEYEELQEAEYARAVEESRRTGKPMKIDHRGRPVMPRWPLVTGILPFLISPGVGVRWVALSAAFIGTISLLVMGLDSAMSSPMFGMCVFAIGSITTMLCAAAASSTLLTIVTESSEGNREIQYWSIIQDWFGELLIVGVGAMMSALPGWAFGKIPFLHLDAGERGLLIAVSMLVAWPIILLSQLDVNSPWGVLSGRVLASIGRCPLSWLFFYLELAAIAAVCGAITWVVARQDPSSVVWLVPLYVAALILFARLLGRLGWRLAEAIPETS